MISASLEALRDELNAFVVAKAPQYLTLPPAVLSDIVTQAGESVVGSGNRADEDNIVVSLVNVDEETHGKDQVFYRENPNGTRSILNPTLQLNLYLLFSSYSGKAADERYLNCLRLLSYVARFFQLKQVFTQANTPSLPPTVEKLVVELTSPTFEEQNHLWGALGAKYMPSIVYRVRLLPIRELDEALKAPLIDEIRAEARSIL